ncbi:antibiotic biosynthesis monooxygenase [Spirillospora sp. NPDC047279]|uniref:antibiotic biosynthesis monooxygenase n=1 Tax=Spirillospora sp. NPDC047279 TaxID=3155478 RepID=UPI0033CF613B
MRVWKGWTRRADADEYEDYMRRTGVVGYQATEGNLGIHLTRREVGDNTEFCFVTFWESMDAVRTFAGDDPERAVFYPDDDRYLVDRDWVVTHYSVVDGAGHP